MRRPSPSGNTVSTVSPAPLGMSASSPFGSAWSATYYLLYPAADKGPSAPFRKGVGAPSTAGSTYRSTPHLRPSGAASHLDPSRRPALCGTASHIDLFEQSAGARLTNLSGVLRPRQAAGR